MACWSSVPTAEIPGGRVPVASNGVTLRATILQSRPVCLQTPARTARLRISQPVTRVTEAIVTARVVFDIAGTTTITKQDNATKLSNVPILADDLPATEPGSAMSMWSIRARRGPGLRDRHYGGG